MTITRILIVEERSSAAGAVVEHFIRKLGPAGVQVTSLSLISAPLAPQWYFLTSEAGIDLNTFRSRNIEDVMGEIFDLVFVLGEKARGSCPVFPGVPPVITLNFSILNSPEKEPFQDFLKDVEQSVSTFFKHGFQQTIENQRRYMEDILDSLKEGIIIHDLDRRILLFSRGAEAMTGLKRENVLGRDCHKVIIPGFCGDQCAFCDKGNYEQMPRASYSTVYLNSQSERHQIQVTRIPVKNECGMVKGVIASLSDETRVKELERKLGEAEEFSGIIGQDYKMLAIYDLIKDLAQSSFSVIVTGESGTGKELVAAAIHNESTRRDKLFVPVNCGALPEGTLESELFGHIKGAFTGAIRDKKGRFELADKGTIFLDEIGELSLPMQVKLLRVLQEGTFEPVGSESPRKVDVRVICATNRNLKEMVAQGKFREDLYYRLAVVPIEVPPLRERKNDIALLVNHFLNSFSRKLGRGEMRISDEALSLMMNYPWPGNVRQLQNALQFALIKCREGELLPEHLPPELTAVSFLSPSEQDRIGKVGRRPKLTAEIVDKALVKAGGNKAKAARILGVGRATLYNFLNGHRELVSEEISV